MYVRPPTDQRGRVNVPENYSGHAFREKSILEDMPPPKHIDSAPFQQKENSDYPSKSYSPQASDAALQDSITNNTEHQETAEPSTKKSTSSIFSSLLPTSNLSASHFPFGHGIGSEEILLLAVMLLVFLSGNKDEEGGDEELLLLLGFLIFAG